MRSPILQTLPPLFFGLLVECLWKDTAAFPSSDPPAEVETIAWASESSKGPFSSLPPFCGTMEWCVLNRARVDPCLGCKAQKELQFWPILGFGQGQGLDALLK